MPKDYTDFIGSIKVKLGIDLHLYKEAQMKRRLTSLRNKRGFNNFADYFQAFSKESELLTEFVDRMTINVSEFYRNPKRWEVLESKVLPYLKKDTNKLSIWSAACSTGEEPYSLAIMMRENFPEMSFQILATDIDEKVLDFARRGIYQLQALKELPLQLKNKYFKEIDGLYHVDETLKKFITFKRHDLLADTYSKQLDLIVCRNVLIYLTDEAKETIYQRFSDALRDSGILFVGSTEQIFTPNKYNFNIFDTFFYEKKQT